MTHPIEGLARMRAALRIAALDLARAGVAVDPRVVVALLDADDVRPSARIVDGEHGTGCRDLSCVGCVDMPAPSSPPHSDPRGDEGDADELPPAPASERPTAIETPRARKSWDELTPAGRRARVLRMRRNGEPVAARPDATPPVASPADATPNALDRDHDATPTVASQPADGADATPPVASCPAVARTGSTSSDLDPLGSADPGSLRTSSPIVISDLEIHTVEATQPARAREPSGADDATGAPDDEEPELTAEDLAQPASAIVDRIEHAGRAEHVPGCEGCERWGACALHGSDPVEAAAARAAAAERAADESPNAKAIAAMKADEAKATKRRDRGAWQLVDDAAREHHRITGAWPNFAPMHLSAREPVRHSRFAVYDSMVAAKAAAWDLEPGTPTAELQEIALEAFREHLRAGEPWRRFRLDVGTRVAAARLTVRARRKRAAEQAEAAERPDPKQTANAIAEARERLFGRRQKPPTSGGERS